MQALSLKHKSLLLLAMLVILIELTLIALHFQSAMDWLGHNLWVVLLPFTKIIVKKLLAMQLAVFLKLMIGLLWHLGKLLLLKVLKTLGLRYGVYFSQARWRWIRYLKVMFLRKGKLFFRGLRHFWLVYSRWQQWLILIAFFPVILLLFLAGLSFNITRKTMVQRAKETAMFEAATSATTRTRGIRARVQQLDAWALDKIKAMNTAKQSSPVVSSSAASEKQ